MVGEASSRTTVARSFARTDGFRRVTDACTAAEHPEVAQGEWPTAPAARKQQMHVRPLSLLL